MELQEEKTINAGLAAHVDAGKTTLTEQLLFRCGLLKAPGNVDEGTTQTDSLPIEQSRGISVKVASASITWGKCRLNIIDTPGHVDFMGEVERSLSVLDAVVLVVSSVEGIQSQTEVLIDAICRLKLPAIVFVNKIDRTGSDFHAVIDALRNAFGKRRIALLNSPAEEGSTACHVSNFDMTSPETVEQLVDAIDDDGLTEEFLNTETVLPSKLAEASEKAFAEARITPVIAGSSKMGIGIDSLLDALSLLASAGTGKDTDELCGQIFKVEHEPGMGKVAHTRLFSGMLRNRDSIFLPRTGTLEKTTQVRRVYGRKSADIAEMHANEIAAIYGLSSAKAGDIIGNGIPPREPFHLATPLFTVLVTPENKGQLLQLVNAIQELTDEDPLLGSEWVPEKQQLHVKITGRIQMEILKVLLSQRYGIEAVMSKPSVIYRETPIKAAEGFVDYTMPKPCWAIIRFLIEPLPRGAGFVYESIVPKQQILERYQTHIQTELPRALKQGLSAWEVTDLKVTLIGGEHHLVHTHPLDFFVATPMALMDGLTNAGTKLLEPVLQATLAADEACLGKTINLLISHRGVFDTPVMSHGNFLMKAQIPVAESFDLPTDFASITSGAGSFSAKFSHYADCPEGAGQPNERRGINPLDRAKWILHARKALADPKG